MPDDLPGDIGSSRGEIFSPVQDTGEVLDISPTPAPQPQATQQPTPAPAPTPAQPAAKPSQSAAAALTQPTTASSTSVGQTVQMKGSGGGPSGLTLPEKGFTKAERAWLSRLITAINTVHAIAGRNCSVSDSDGGQVINAEDCAPCP